MIVKMPDDLSAIGGDIRTCTDELRPRQGLIRNDRGEWEVLRHELVVQAALSDELFSNAVSSHRQIPNGLDSAEHTAYRNALDRFLMCAYPGKSETAPLYKSTPCTTFRADFVTANARISETLPNSSPS